MFKKQIKAKNERVHKIGLASLTAENISEFTPNGDDQPPAVYKGEPLVIATLDDEWKKRFTLFRKSKRAIDVAEAAPIVDLIQGLEGPVTQLFAEVKEGQPGGWTQRDLSKRVSALLNGDLKSLLREIDSPEPEEFDVHVVDTFWGELRRHLEESGAELPEDVCPLDHLNLGVFSEWQVAVTGHKDPMEMMMGSGGLLESLLSGGGFGGVEIVEIR